MLKSRSTFKDAIESPALSLMSRHRLKVAQREFYSRLNSLAGLNDGIEAFRLRRQKELGLSQSVRKIRSWLSGYLKRKQRVFWIAPMQFVRNTLD
jgi:hypothetical protein